MSILNGEDSGEDGIRSFISGFVEILASFIGLPFQVIAFFGLPIYLAFVAVSGQDLDLLFGLLANAWTIWTQAVRVWQGA